jgi:hypothetical protein
MPVAREVRKGWLVRWSVRLRGDAAWIPSKNFLPNHHLDVDFRNAFLHTWSWQYCPSRIVCR